MRITGDSDSTNQIVLTYNDTSVKFRYLTHLFHPSMEMQLQKTANAEIIFKSLSELDELISMLKEFRNQCSDHIGSWERIYD